MGTKTIRIREEVYDRLASRKRPNESFSDLLDRLTDREAAFDRGFGALKEVDFEAARDDLAARLNEDFRRE